MSAIFPHETVADEAGDNMVPEERTDPTSHADETNDATPAEPTSHLADVPPEAMDVVESGVASNETTSVVSPPTSEPQEKSVVDKATVGRPWDYSNRKVMVQGINKFHDVKAVTKDLNKWLNDLNSQKKSDDDDTELIAFDRIKKPPKGNWMVITFKAESMIQPFINYINTNPELYSRRGNKLFAKPAIGDDNDARGESDARPRNNKRSVGGDDVDGGIGTGRNEQASKRQRKMLDGAEVQNARRPITEEEMKDKVTPLWRLPAEEQLDVKMKEMIKKCAMKIVQELKQKFRYVPCYNDALLAFSSCVLVFSLMYWLQATRQGKDARKSASIPLANAEAMYQYESNCVGTNTT
jgi:hypothetical protein